MADKPDTHRHAAAQDLDNYYELIQSVSKQLIEIYGEVVRRWHAIFSQEYAVIEGEVQNEEQQ